MIKCIKGHEIKVLESGAGYYVGTLDPVDGCPYCRISDYSLEPMPLEYYPVGRMATASECVWCNNGCHCVTGESFIDIFKRC